MNKLLFVRLVWVCSLSSAYVARSVLAAALTAHSYDSLNRLTNTAYSDGARESYSYDSAATACREPRWRQPTYSTPQPRAFPPTA